MHKLARRPWLSPQTQHALLLQCKGYARVQQHNSPKQLFGQMRDLHSQLVEVLNVVSAGHAMPGAPSMR